MAFKLYHRFSAADFKRYREFFPKLEIDGADDDEPPRTDVDKFLQRTCHDATSNSNRPIIDGMQMHYAIWGKGYDAWCKISKPPIASPSSGKSAINPQLQVPPASNAPMSQSPSVSHHQSSSPPVQVTSPRSPSTSSPALPLEPTSSSTSNHARSRCRKSSRPRKSPRKNDPKFKGVVFSVQTAITECDHRPATKLCIKPHFSSRHFRRLAVSRRLSYRHRAPSSGSLLDDEASSETDTESGSGSVWLRSPPARSKSMMRPPVIMPTMRTSFSTPLCRTMPKRPSILADFKGQGKQCESCKTRRTPLWRDAEDGTPLCNACGIRYKKYRIRCPYCWLIPRKDSKTFPRCARCGVLLRMTLPRRTSYL